MTRSIALGLVAFIITILALIGQQAAFASTAG
jgi:hypothetical protein